MNAERDSIRVLHIDDDADFADAATTSLEREDSRVATETTTSAAEGLDLLSEREFDCVVSEYDLPRMDGIEFLETVREDHPDLPFILLTSAGSEEVASEAISTGVTDYLRKERATDEYTALSDCIRSAVDSYRSRAELTERNRKLRKYERMVNTMQEAACIYDPDGRFEIVNEYLADWYGTTQEELEGRQSNLVPYIREQGETDRYEELLDGSRVEIRGELADEFPGQGSAVIEYRLKRLTVNGRVAGAVGVARDITERVEREQELQRQNERLDEFASVVSHDLRNPLQVANGRLELVRTECDSEHLEHVSHALDRMNTLVDDLLTLAREGETVTDPERINLAAVAEESWATVETDSATLVTDTNRTVEADESRLKQVFENLVRNAIEHGGEDVTVTVGDMENGFYIEDDGPGIPEDERDDVFDTGYSTTEAGTGFGLRIVEEVVETHGWDISATGGSDGGARFEVTGVEDISE
jgi:PAS domain S-box-containing protein